MDHAGLAQHPQLGFGFTIATGGPIPRFRSSGRTRYESKVLFGYQVLILKFHRRTADAMTQAEQYQPAHSNVESGQDMRLGHIKFVGDRIALTPPMGWSSWNCWGGSVSQEKVLASARGRRS